MVPEACCQKNSKPGDVASISKEECLMGSVLFRNNKVCWNLQKWGLYHPEPLEGTLSLSITVEIP